MVRVLNNGFSPQLTRVYNSSDIELTSLSEEILGKSLIKIVEAMEGPEIGKELEVKLLTCLQSFVNGTPLNIDDSIKVSFDIIKNHYLENYNDD